MKTNRFIMKQRLKIVLIVIFSLIVIEGKSQKARTITPRFKPFSYEELMGPILVAEEAYRKGVYDLEEAYVKGVEAMEKGNNKLALFYFKRCSDINRRFEYSICDQEELNSYIKSLTTGSKSTLNQGSVVIELKLNNEWDISLYKSNSILSERIVKIPPCSVVYVLEQKEDETFMKVRYKEWVGYISREWLKN